MKAGFGIAKTMSSKKQLSSHCETVKVFRWTKSSRSWLKPTESRLFVLLRDRETFAFGVARLLILLLELVDTASGVYQLLAAGEEGMAVGADFHADVALVGRARLEHIATGTDDVEFVISGVNTSFHFEKGTFRNFYYSKI